MDKKPFDTITVTFVYQGNNTYHARIYTLGGNSMTWNPPSYIPVKAEFVELLDKREAARSIVQKLLNGEEQFTFDISEFAEKEKKS